MQVRDGGSPVRLPVERVRRGVAVEVPGEIHLPAELLQSDAREIRREGPVVLNVPNGHNHKGLDLGGEQSTY